MFVQLIKARVKPGSEDEILRLQKEFEARGQDGSTGWARSIALQSKSDPQVYYNLVFFESEEKARANEGKPEQQELVKQLQAQFEGAPEFVDLNFVYEGSR